MNPKIATRTVFLLFVLLTLSAGSVLAQNTAFTYQGKLSDGGAAANGNYDLQFALFEIAAGGNQISATQTLNSVAVSGGIFSVSLDFGAGAFPGASRYLEISARVSGGGAFTTLAPRQQISSTPYAIRSLIATTADTATTATNATTATTATNATTAATATNATQLGGVAANQYVQTSDARLSDARVPAAGSSNYIQNSSVSQAAANFNISGNGTAGGALSANIVNATAQYNLGGNRVLSVAGTNNTFAGRLTGAANTSGVNNSFFGNSAGAANAGGADNSFFGSLAGTTNTIGYDNSFFGHTAGAQNTTGFSNSFFGRSAGQLTSVGTQNSFFGVSSGYFNETGIGNSFFGRSSGGYNVHGLYNSFFGFQAGESNLLGNWNTVIGANADVALENLQYATAIGANASVSQSNSLVLGSISGVNSAPTDTNVGIGTTAPKARLHIAVNGGNILVGNAGCSSTFAGIGFGAALTGCANYSLLGNGTDTIINRPTGGAIAFRENNSNQMSIAAGGVVSITTLGSAGSTSLCRNASNQISTCSSSLRYKKDFQPFTRGLSLLNSLKPITFRWKADNSSDLGFGAEDIAAVEPLLVTRNGKGEVEGVKYDRLTAVLVNAVKEQQSQIERQQTAAQQQQDQIDALLRANTALIARLQSVERIVRKRAGSSRRRY